MQTNYYRCCNRKIDKEHLYGFTWLRTFNKAHMAFRFETKNNRLYIFPYGKFR